MRRPAPRGFGRVEAAAWRDCHLRRQRDSRRSVRGQLRDRPHPHEGGRRASELTRARRPRCREYRDPNDAGVWSAAGRVSETRPSHASHLPSCSRGCSTPTAPAWLRVSDRNSVAASPGAVTRVLLLRGSRHPRSHGLTAAFWQRRSRSTGRNELDLRRGQAVPRIRVALALHGWYGSRPAFDRCPGKGILGRVRRPRRRSSRPAGSAASLNC